MFHPAKEQPASFAFTSEYQKKADAIIKKYPVGKEASAILPLFDLAQRQSGGWLPRAAIETVAGMLNMPVMRAYEVASFYSMHNLAPVGEHFIQVCRTTPCWLRGSEDILKACKDKLGVGVKQTTEDGKFTLVEVECLGACANAPMVQINDDYYEDLTPEQMKSIIDQLAAGKAVKPGPQNGRLHSCPEGGATTLNAAGKPSKQKGA
jgi:NADH-quinone oxidoreductase subunit E